MNTFLVKMTEHGKRLHILSVDDAEVLVAKGQAKKLRNGLYQHTARGSVPTSTTRKLGQANTKTVPSKSKKR